MFYQALSAEVKSGKKAKGRRQKAKGRKQKAEGRRQKDNIIIIHQIIIFPFFINHLKEAERKNEN